MASRICLLAAVSLCLLSVEGCLRTLVKVETNPPGALVHYDYEPKGNTPAEFEVDWYGKHRLTLDHPEYGQQVKEIHLNAPAYLTFPMDFFVAIMPFTVVDRHEFQFDLSEEAAQTVEESNHESEGTQSQSAND